MNQQLPNSGPQYRSTSARSIATVVVAASLQNPLPSKVIQFVSSVAFFSLRMDFLLFQ